MIFCRECKAKDKEIEWLRARLTEAMDRLMCLVPDAMERLDLTRFNKKQMDTPLTMLESIPADTPEEERQKAEARAEIMQIMGH